ncbi:TonB-dependent receptor [Derxia gummosa]|uniref:TonB-dependent receptor n=1 Tax=Derxia gummosa DSM 723 TaxID=1121388 RepID=A0A8B6X9B9_9BURK|nr:TonB-dependent receptor [Derxia gummosa]
MTRLPIRRDRLVAARRRAPGQQPPAAFRPVPRPLLLALAIAFSATPAHAADAPAEPAASEAPALGAVTVRSRNRIERLQDVPLSVSVVTGAELERLQATDVEAITKRVANVTWNPGNPRQFSLGIRGIGKQGQTDAQDPSVGIIVDGINYAYNPLASSLDFTDIDTVEVTRGPQGTLLGKNTSLGVINITTRKPSFVPEGRFLVSYGQRQTLYSTATYGGPVIDDLLAWRGTVSATKGRGDLVNAYNPDLSYANRDRYSGRLRLLLTPSASFSALLTVDAQPRAGEASNGRSYNTATPTRYADGTTNPLNTDASTRLARPWFTRQSSYSYLGDYLGNAGRGYINADNYNPIVTGTNGGALELNWKLGGHTLTSITGIRNYYFDARNDEGTPFDISKNGGGLVNYRQLSQELRLSSPTGGFVDYQTGLYAIETDIDHSTRTGWGSDAGAWFSSRSQYTTLDADTSGRALLQDSLNRLYKRVDNQYNNRSAAIFGQANWHFSDALTLTTGLRLTHEDRNTRSRAYLDDQGAGTLLNPASVNGINLGGFLANNAGALSAGNSAAQLGVADAVAARYFGRTITATPGEAYNSLSDAQKAQVAAARSLRRNQAGVLWNQVEAQPFRKNQPAFVLSPSWKFGPDLTGYVSWQYGEKAGISQNVNGISYLTKPERTNSFELGAKTVLLDRTLVFNADVFLMKIRDYQQAVQTVDAYTTAQNRLPGGSGETAWTSYTGNAPKVQAHGLEIDGVFAGIRNTTVRFSGAYNVAKYKEFGYLAQPVENGNLATSYRDVAGQTLPGASKFTFNVGVDYRRPVLDSKLFHTSFNTTYASRFNSDNALSSYGWVGASTVTDASIGLGRQDNSLDVSLIVKNLFGNDQYQARTWNSYTPALPRWVGVTVSGKL